MTATNTVVEMDTLVASEAVASHKFEKHEAPSETAGDPKPKSPFNDFVRVFTFARPIDRVLGGVGILGAVGSGVGLAMVNLIIGDFISIITGFTSSSGSSSASSDFMSEVSKYALYFVYIGIARFVCTYIYSTLLTYVAFNITRNIRREYLKSALRQEVSYFDQGTSGSISMQATSDGKLIQLGISEKFGQIFQALATFVAAFVLAFISQWKLTLILMSIVPVLVVVGGIGGGADAAIEAEILKKQAQAGSFAETVLGSIRTVKAFSLRNRMTQEHSRILHEARVAGSKKSPVYAMLFSTQYFLVFADMGLAFWQGIAMLARGEVKEMGTIFTVLFSVIIAASTLNSIAPHMTTFSRAATAAGELFELIDRESNIDPFGKSGDMPLTTEGSIELENVTFSYPSRPDTTVLDSYTLSVPAGKVSALVGSSGSGKSTIIGLLERWYNPSTGTIKLDGKDIDQLNLRWLRTNMRLVQQEPVLFDGTVFENICHGLVGTPWENISRDEKLQRVKTAAQTAFANDFIQGLPKGYDTRIGERGGLLSGGQKQRIAIARSIISEPKILLLDEATSALDPHAEGIVQKALDEASKNRTTIVIAHKLKTIQNADNIVVMQKGRIVEQGRHDDLVARGSAYAKLVAAQDLSPTSEKHSSDDGGYDSGDEAALKLTNTLQTRQTGIDGQVTLQDPEDYSLNRGTGVFHAVYKLTRLVPEIKGWYVLIMVVCVLGAGLYPGQALLLGRAMDVFGAEDMQSRGNFIALMFFIMSLGLVLIYGTLGWTANVISQTFGEKIRTEMFASLLRQDLRFFDRPENTVGALTSKIDSHAQAIFELMGFNFGVICMAIVSVLVCGVLSIAFSWKLGLVGVCAGIPPMLLAGYARIRVETAMDLMMDAKFARSASIASETVTSIRTVSSLAIEDDVLRRYTAELDSGIRGSRASLVVIMIWFSLTQSIEYCILALGFWYGSKLVSEGQISFYEFFVSFMAVYFSGQGAALMFSFSSSFTKANSAANYFFWLRDLEPTVQETRVNKDRAPANGCRSYDLDDVQFAYPLAPKNRVLKGLSFQIHPGQFVAFVGASGCGKSTMVSLLERFYDPTTGTIAVDDGTNLADLNPDSYRANVALVQQEPTLFPGSIRDNIAMGLLDSTTDEAVDDAVLERACRAANAWDFVSSLPEGLNTPCGAGGSQLSGGQRQRIAIARALVRDPKVILLDEATSALDTESERVVQAALMQAARAGDRITVAVAHRLSTVRDADCIFVFSGGRIVECGSHGELVARGGMYTKMCEAQSLDSGL